VSLHAAEAAARTQWLSSIESFETRYSSDVRPLEFALSAIEPGRSVIGAERPRQVGEFAVLKVSAVDPLGFQPEESKVLLRQDEFMPEHSVRAGDILMTRSNTSELVGESCLVSSSHASLMLCDKTLRLVPREGISPIALWHMLQGRRVRKQIYAVATGTGGAMKNISQPKIRALQVCVPTEVRQAREIEEVAGSAYRAFLRLRARRVASDIVRSSVVNRTCRG
jgi:type I restriction enzyme S subunit